MQAGISAYVLFLIAGVVAIFVDGWFIRRSGATYLAAMYTDRKAADEVNRLITVLFHLALLGVFALISVLPGATGAQPLIARFGALLLVMALAHGLTVWVFTRMRGKQREQRLQDEIAVRTEEGFDQAGQPRASKPLGPPRAGTAAGETTTPKWDGPASVHDPAPEDGPAPSAGRA